MSTSSEPGCGDTETITRTWTVTDACGNTSTCVQMVYVVDTTPPSITCPADAVVDCATGSTDPSETGSATGDDTCGNVTINFADGQPLGGCEDGFIRTWTATDDCGNTATCQQNISIVDTTPPSITANADARS